MEILEIGDLRERSGLRIVLVAGAPSPWGQAAKAMIEFKGLDYSAGHLIPGDANSEVVEWSGVNSGPVVAWNDEKPIDRWNDILFLLERLAPNKPLVPDDPQDRVEFFGMAHEINGEFGLGWNRRLMMFGPILESGQAPDGMKLMGDKYNYNKTDAELASRRIVGTLTQLSNRLKKQKAAGSNYFIGSSPTAMDFYWTAFSNLVEIISWEKIPVAEPMRPLFDQGDPAIAAAFDSMLREHRDRFFDQYFKSPMEF
ncbi:MAG: glutathione S-transferase [Gammaproteobacteria bacterium]|jgi:glutathione S-transferase